MIEDIIQNNPAFLGMTPEKLEFVKNFMKMEKPKNMNQAMPFLIAQMGLARKKNINFSKPEVQLISQLLSRDMPAEDQAKIAKMMKLIGT